MFAGQADFDDFKVRLSLNILPKVIKYLYYFNNIPFTLSRAVHIFVYNTEIMKCLF